MITREIEITNEIDHAKCMRIAERAGWHAMVWVCGFAGVATVALFVYAAIGYILGDGG